MTDSDDNDFEIEKIVRAFTVALRNAKFAKSSKTLECDFGEKTDTPKIAVF